MAGDEGSPASTPFNAIYETPQGNWWPGERWLGRV